MRFDKGLEELKKHKPDRIVLTEQDFFDVFNNPTSIFNYTFLHLLREHTALFVGLSMEDENLRRLLHYSKVERFTALKAEGEEDSKEIRGEVQRHVALLKRKSADVDRVTVDTLGRLGVHVIWVDDFDQIPTHLAQYETTGESWESVYG
jgi:SIR2-like domain